MSYLLSDWGKTEYEKWKNQKPVRKAAYGEHHTRKCALCPDVFEDSLPTIDIHLLPQGVCFKCANECYYGRDYSTWEGVLEMRQKHINYWAEITGEKGVKDEV